MGKNCTFHDAFYCARILFRRKNIFLQINHFPCSNEIVAWVRLSYCFLGNHKVFNMLAGRSNKQCQGFPKKKVPQYKYRTRQIVLYASLLFAYSILYGMGWLPLTSHSQTRKKASFTSLRWHRCAERCTHKKQVRPKSAFRNCACGYVDWETRPICFPWCSSLCNFVDHSFAISRI